MSPNSPRQQLDDSVDALMQRYLAHLSVGQPDAYGPPENPRSTAQLVAFMADSLGWTEHGSGIWGGSWLTPAGETALAELRSLEDTLKDGSE